jgi:hypothetical protein
MLDHFDDQFPDQLFPTSTLVEKALYMAKEGVLVKSGG